MPVIQGVFLDNSTDINEQDTRLAVRLARQFPQTVVAVFCGNEVRLRRGEALALIDRGAVSVSAYVSHGVLSGAASDRVTKSSLTELVITDTIRPTDATTDCSKIRVLAIAPLVGEAVRRIADEIAELEVAGLTAHQALGAGCWDARSWLGAQGIEEGAPADLVVYSEDPRGNPDVLAKPMRVILRGTPVSG